MENRFREVVPTFFWLKIWHLQVFLPQKKPHHFHWLNQKDWSKDEFHQLWMLQINRNVVVFHRIKPKTPTCAPNFHRVCNHTKPPPKPPPDPVCSVTSDAWEPCRGPKLPEAVLNWSKSFGTDRSDRTGLWGMDLESFFLSYFLKIVMKYMFFLFFGCRVWMFWFLNICECALKDLFESFTSESWRRWDHF